MGYLQYLIRIYFKIRADRNDLIRKEEALSSLFYVIDSIEGNIADGKGGFEKSRYKVLENKIPDFPLLKLFEGTSDGGNRRKGGDVDLTEVIGTLNTSISTQHDLIMALKDIIDSMDKKKKKD